MARILRSCLQQLVQAIYFHASHNVSWKSFRTGLDVSPSVRGSPSSRPPVKWKNGKDGKYNDTRDARARARSCTYTNAMEVSTGQVVPEDQEEKPLLSSSSGNKRGERRRRGSSFSSLSLPVSISVPLLRPLARKRVSFFFFFRSRSIKIYSRTEAEILRGLPPISESTHIFRHRNVLLLSFFFFVHARNKSQLVIIIQKLVKSGRGVFLRSKFKLYSFIPFDIYFLRCSRIYG